MRTLIQPLVVAAAFSAAPLLAQDGDNPFSKLDKNEDGIVTKEEVGADGKATLERLLKDNDIDGDGKLTKEDFPEYMRNRHAEYDANKDGVVTFEEYKTGMQNQFRRR